MVKKRLFKIGTIQRNMLTRGLQELPQAAGPDMGEIIQLLQKIWTLPGERLYLDEREYRWAVLALNGLRDSLSGRPAAAAAASTRCCWGCCDPSIRK